MGSKWVSPKEEAAESCGRLMSPGPAHPLDSDRGGLVTSLRSVKCQGADMSQSQSPTHIDEEDGHLQLCNPPAQTLPNTPAKAQVPEVGGILAFFQPTSWVKLVWIGKEARISTHGKASHLYQSLGAR